jgi:hypothetical protein
VGFALYKGKSIPSQVPLSWQPEQPVVVLAWMLAAVGNEVLNVVAAGAFAEISPEGLTVWQVWQSAVDGKCEFGPGVLEAGITTMLGLPAKLEPLIP